MVYSELMDEYDELTAGFWTILERLGASRPEGKAHWSVSESDLLRMLHEEGSPVSRDQMVSRLADVSPDFPWDVTVRDGHYRFRVRS